MTTSGFKSRTSKPRENSILDFANRELKNSSILDSAFSAAEPARLSRADEQLHHALRRQLRTLRSPAALRAGGFIFKDMRFERSMSSIWNESMSCKTMNACLVLERMHECQKPKVEYLLYAMIRTHF